MKLSKRAQKLHDAWLARVEADELTVGKHVYVTRVITDSRNMILHKWQEPATIVEIRNFDALVEFHSDHERGSSGLGLAPLPTYTNPAVAK